MYWIIQILTLFYLQNPYMTSAFLYIYRHKDRQVSREGNETHYRTISKSFRLLTVAEPSYFHLTIPSPAPTLPFIHIKISIFPLSSFIFYPF